MAIAVRLRIPNLGSKDNVLILRHSAAIVTNSTIFFVGLGHYVAPKSVSEAEDYDRLSILLSPQ